MTIAAELRLPEVARRQPVPAGGLVHGSSGMGARLLREVIR